MSEPKWIARSSMKGRGIYLYDGGMAPSYRTLNPDELTVRLRLRSLFYPHILLHPANILEEDALFHAVSANLGLLSCGIVLPVMRGGIREFDAYARRWKEGYEDPKNKGPVYVRSQPVTEEHVSEIMHRGEYLAMQDHTFLLLESPNRSGLKPQFMGQVVRILNKQPELDTTIKRKIIECASADLSPLGRIINEALGDEDLEAPIYQQILREINLAFFSVGAWDLDSYWSVSKPAFRDVSNPKMGCIDIDEILEHEIPEALNIVAGDLLAIPDQDFAEIANSPEAHAFRTWLGRVVSSFERQEPERTGVVDPLLSEAFSDYLGVHLQKTLARVDHKEKQRLAGISFLIILTGVTSELFANYTLSSRFPGMDDILQFLVSEATGGTAAFLADRTVRPGLERKLTPKHRLRHRLANAPRKLR